MSPFFASLYAFCVTRGHVILTLARRCHQILRVRGKSDIFQTLYAQIKNFVPVKMVYAMIWFMKLQYAFSDRQHARL